MLNTNLAKKIIKDKWKSTLYYITGVSSYMLMLAAIFPSIKNMKGIEELIESYPKEILKLFGASEINITDFSNYVTMEFLGLISVVIIGAYVFSFARGMISGELKDGTLELLLSQPVERWKVISTQVIIMIAGITSIIVSIVVSAFVFGTAFKLSVSYRGFAAYIPVAFSLFFCVGGYTLLFTAIFPKRGTMTAIGVTLVLYMLNFAASVSEPVHKLRFLSIFNYYDPAGALKTGTPPAVDIIVLITLGTLCYIGATIKFDRMNVAV